MDSGLRRNDGVRGRNDGVGAGMAVRDGIGGVDGGCRQGGLKSRQNRVLTTAAGPVMLVADIGYQ